MQPTLEPIWSTQPHQWDARMAAHLLRRAGFGGTLEEIDQAVAAGPQQTIAMLCEYERLPSNFPELEFGDLTAPTLAKRKAGGAGARANGEMYRNLEPN